MEKLLRQLFDFHRFEPNRRLAGIIAETERRSRLGNFFLTDDDLFDVSAGAGLPDPKNTMTTLGQDGNPTV